MYHQPLGILPWLPCLHQDFQDKPIKYFEKRHHFNSMARSHRDMLILCQWNISVQERQIQEVFRRVWQKEKVSALLRHLCRFPDYTVSDILFIARQRMREDKLKSKNNYELYYSRKIGKSSYMGMEQVCEENCHSLQGNWLSLFGLGLSSDRYFAFWRT